MVTSYIKGADGCIFRHIHLQRGFGIYIYIYSPINFFLPMNPCDNIVINKDFLLHDHEFTIT